MHAGWERSEQQEKKLFYSLFPVLEGDKMLLYAVCIKKQDNSQCLKKRKKCVDAAQAQQEL